MSHLLSRVCLALTVVAESSLVTWSLGHRRQCASSGYQGCGNWGAAALLQSVLMKSGSKARAYNVNDQLKIR